MVSQELPDRLLAFLNGKDLEMKQHEAMMILTITEDMWPHTAMVSVGEVVALNATELRIGLWPETTTTNNILRNGKAMLVVVYQGMVYYIRLSMEPLPTLSNPRHPLVRFSALVILAREDVAKYAEITSGVQFQLNDPPQVLIRWRETVEELLY